MDPDAPSTVRRVRDFLTDHSECSFDVTVVLPLQRVVPAPPYGEQPPS